MTADDYHDGWTYRGGALCHGFVMRWLLNAFAPNQLARLRREQPALAARSPPRSIRSPTTRRARCGSRPSGSPRRSRR